MSMIEMMIALIIFSVVLATSLGFISRLSKGFDKSATDMGMLQNLSFANQLLEQELRLAGANVPYKQPSVLYAGTDAFAYNADYASNTDSTYAVYYNPGLPSGQVSSLTSAQKFTLPGTSPGFAYPDSNYYMPGNPLVSSPAETLIWFFQLDASTTDANDYVLMRQVNDNTPETVIRNIYKTGTLPFYRYWYKRIPASGTSNASLDTVPTAWMPVRHSIPIHGAVTDTGAAARVDSLAMVEVNFTVTNGLSGTNQRTRAINFMVALPNNGIKKVTSCGGAPLFGSAATAAWQINTLVTPPDTFMNVSWNQAIDETGGEKDVTGYVIWRRQVGAATWGNPIAVVPAGDPTPGFQDEDVTVHPGVTPAFQYAVAAEDCTPSLSMQSTATANVSYP
jgi:hypothetical protein